MNLFQLMILFSIIGTSVIGLFVFVAQPKRQINQAFIFLSVNLVAWQGALWGASIAQHASGLDFWIRQSSAIAALVPPCMNLLRLAILRTKKCFFTLVLSNTRWFLWWGLVAILCQTPPFLRSVDMPPAGQMLAKPLYGWGFLLYSFYFISSWILLFRKLFRSKRIEKGYKQSEIEYLLLSCAISLFVGVFFLIIPIITGLIDLGAALPLSVILFSGITSYGIATRGILDVPVVARRVVAWGTLMVYLFLLFAAVLFGMRQALPLLGQEAEPLATILAVSAVMISVSPAKGLLQGLANKLFITTPPLDEGQALREANRRLQTIQTSDELYERFSSLLAEFLDTEEVRIFIREEGRFTRVHPAGKRESMPLDHGIPSALEENCQIVIQEMMERSRNPAGQSTLRKELEKDNVSAAIGFYEGMRLDGFFLLGPRASGRIYGSIESSVLEGFRDVFSVAYKNATLYEKIRRNERLASIGTLAAGMAHEIKNPLVTLKTFTQLVPERYEDPEFRESFSKLVGKEIDRIDTLVNQLLHFARPVKPDFRPISLQDLLQEQVEGFTEQAKRDHLTLKTSYQATYDRILGDANLLEQVMLNLFLNARDAMENEGILEVSCMDGEAGLVVEISDSGEGIDPSLVDHIFDPFYTTKSQGTGLGLAVAHRILEEHHVTTTVRSVKGQGTTFHLVFPILPEGLPS
jgi:signal transduction histidine kinase